MKCTILTYLLTYLSREVLAVRWHRGVEQCHARQDITIISRLAFRNPGRTGWLAGGRAGWQYRHLTVTMQFLSAHLQLFLLNDVRRRLTTARARCARVPVSTRACL